MTKIIPFPEPYEQNLKLAKKAIQDENYIEAKKILTKLYKQKTTFEVSQLLVKLYVIDGEEAKALQLADELEDDYLSSMDGIKQYFQLIVLNYQFIRAHILLNSGRKHNFFAEEQNMLILFEQVYEQTNRAVFEEKKRQFASFKQMTTPVTQEKWNQWLIGITKQQFEQLVIPALDENNSPFLTSRCCEVLVKIGEQRTLTVKHPLNKESKALSFEKISLLEKSVSFQQLSRLLVEEYSSQPYIFEALFAEIVGHWAFLFPFVPKEDEVADWLPVYERVYLDDEFTEMKADRPIVAEIEKQMQSIRQILQNFE